MRRRRAGAAGGAAGAGWVRCWWRGGWAGGGCRPGGWPCGGVGGRGVRVGGVSCGGPERVRERSLIPSRPGLVPSRPVLSGVARDRVVRGRGGPRPGGAGAGVVGWVWCRLRPWWGREGVGGCWFVRVDGSGVSSVRLSFRPVFAARCLHTPGSFVRVGAGSVSSWSDPAAWPRVVRAVRGGPGRCGAAPEGAGRFWMVRGGLGGPGWCGGVLCRGLAFCDGFLLLVLGRIAVLVRVVVVFPVFSVSAGRV